MSEYITAYYSAMKETGFFRGAIATAVLAIIGIITLVVALYGRLRGWNEGDWSKKIDGEGYPIGIA
jgi:hypothetical protein